MTYSVIINQLAAEIIDEVMVRERVGEPMIDPEQDDAEFDAAVERALSAMGDELRKARAVRQAQGLADVVRDASPERQAEIMEKLKAEIERLRPPPHRLLTGKD